ncbi:hypothetical protein Zm00014a_036743 [Zea mays]|uniref:Uncharacterized protein n=1 Tax=Zea mays TaxID=4577 RepID=A0A3L6E420_MAIZE|nr:hypothetical protein Zm00014a_036743 [Zea mays]
MQIKAKRNHY